MSPTTNSSIGLKTLGLAAVLAIILLTSWEMAVRSKGYVVAPDDTKGLWAEQRSKLEKLGPDDVVFIGSSRVMFDFQLDEWEEITGRRPVMLAAAGTTPMPVLIDIVENSSFNGTLIIGVTPPLYYLPFMDDIPNYARIKSWIDHYHKRTPAERWNHTVNKFPQSKLAFLNSTEETFYDELDLRTMLERLDPHPPRAFKHPPFPAFQYINKDRNTTMLPRMYSDTNMVNEVTGFWTFAINPPPEKIPPPEVQEQGRLAMIDLNVNLVKAFQARGGNPVYMRCPSSEDFRFVESMAFPRTKYWDDLIAAVDVPAYHFEDYDFMSRYTLPEWSHLATPDAKQFTKDVLNQMIEDGAITITNP